MPLAPEERQGYLGKLEDKTITELKDLLFRQEKLLCKQAFLKSLPDKGAKVKQFAESLERLIHEKVAEEKSQNSSEDIKEIINLTSAFSSVQNVTKFGESSSSYQHDVAEDSIRSMINPAALPGGNTKMIVDHREVDPSYSENEAMADSLTESFQKVKISNKNTGPNNLNVDKSVNHYENVIRKAGLRPKTNKAPFKPNSSLVISKVEDLPDKYKHRSVTGNKNCGDSNALGLSETASTLKSRTHEESAAYPPAYKYNRAIIVSDEESKRLITDQQSKLEELLAQRAAARLAERLNIKMDSYKPKEVDMSYRQKKEFKDSDDDDDDDDDETEVCSYPD